MASKFNTSSFSAALQAAVAASQATPGNSTAEGFANSITGLVELNLMQLRELQIHSQLLAVIAGVPDSDVTQMRGDPGIL